MGYFNIGEYIGDPRQVSESVNTYPDLDRLRDSYFDKYYKNYDWKDYIRLIKYFDNSLFKMIKDFTPAKSSLATGVVIKQHLLERNKQRPAQVEISQHDYSGSVYSQQVWDPIVQDTYISNSKINKIEGGAGGTFNDVNNLGSNPEGQSQGFTNDLAPFVTQSWVYRTEGISGSIFVTQSTQDEFYNGELNGSTIITTNGDLNSTIVVETANVTEGFIAPYIDVTQGGYNEFPGGNGQFRYTTIGTDGIGGYAITQLFFSQNDSNVIERFNYTINYEQPGYRVGDILQIRTRNGNYPGIYNFVIQSVSYGSNQFNMVFDIEPYPIYGYSNDWLSTDDTPGFSIEFVFDPSITNLQSNILGDEPLQNNAVDSRLSTIFDDIDYSTGLITPTNMNVIGTNEATKATVPDSNYSQTAWTRGRYKGSRGSSLDFNQ